MVEQVEELPKTKGVNVKSTKRTTDISNLLKKKEITYYFFSKL